MYIDKAKLLDNINKEIRYTQTDAKTIALALSQLRNKIESGTFDAEPVSNTDELNRYRTALKKIRDSHEPIPDWVFNLVNDALEGHESTEGRRECEDRNQRTLRYSGTF